MIHGAYETVEIETNYEIPLKITFNGTIYKHQNTLVCETGIVQISLYNENLSNQQIEAFVKDYGQNDLLDLFQSTLKNRKRNEN